MSAIRYSIRLSKPYAVEIGATAVQLTSSGLCSGISLKAVCPGNTIYIGTDNTVSTTTGWPLGDFDTWDLEISEASQLWAIATAAAQVLIVAPHVRT